MSTNDNKTREISTTDVNLTSEMDVPLTQTSQMGESSTTAFVQSETIPITSISSSQDVHKTDGTAAMMQLLLNKFDEQSNKFDVKLDEIKNEIKNRNENLNKQCDIVISKLDEQLIQIENQKVSSSENMTKNEVLINKVSNSDNLNNEFTGNKNDMILEKDDESIMSDNEVFECVESERELRDCLLYTSEIIIM